MSDFHEVEASDGVRWSWNVWPSSRLEATRMVVPLGCLYTPLKPIENLPVLEYEPVVCKGSCPSVLNPFCRVDYKTKVWVCPFCFQRNNLPPNYDGITEDYMPTELIPNCTTVEYQLPRSPAGPPVFLWAIDTCLDESELQALKESLLQAVNMIATTAPNALLGLIQRDKVARDHVRVWSVPPPPFDLEHLATLCRTPRGLVTEHPPPSSSSSMAWAPAAVGRSGQADARNPYQVLSA